jgi:hypothetical protein
MLSYRNKEKFLSHHEVHEGHEERKIIILNLRALRVLRGENFYFYFGCGSAAPGPPW